MKIIQRTVATGGFDAASVVARDIVDELNDDFHHVASISHYSVNGSILIVIAYVENGNLPSKMEDQAHAAA